MIRVRGESDSMSLHVPSSSPSRRGSALRPLAPALRPIALAATALALTLPASTLGAAGAESKAPYAAILAGPGRSVVVVRYQMRPKERPKGGEGPKQRKFTTGVVAGPPGQVMINASAFPGSDEGPDSIEPFDFKITVGDGVEVDADVAGVSREMNLAFLRARNPAELAVLPAAKFETSPELTVGDELIVVGLLAEPYDFQRVAYTIHLNARLTKPRTMFSLDQTLPDLCGGGLVLRPDGREVGFLGLDLLPESWQNTSPGNVLSLFGSAEQSLKKLGYLMVYPASLYAGTLASPPEVEAEKSEKKGWLGITMQPLSKDLADYWKIDGAGGVIVGAVLDGSPADRAGVKAGDVITGVDGEPLPVRENKDLSLVQKRIRAAGAGRDVPIKIWRGGAERDLQVRLSSAPTTIATAEEYENDEFGFTVRELTYDVIQGLNLDPGTRGVIVSKTERAGWVDVAGIGRGDIIQTADGAAVTDLASLKTVLEKARGERKNEISLLVYRNYRTRFVRVQTSWK